ncbi:MAG: hypothetical protein Q8P22_14445 [Chloroflexota bacterium]|nr:hypothetical protein [Chloroflexota bacterium]
MGRVVVSYQGRRRSIAKDRLGPQQLVPVVWSGDTPRLREVTGAAYLHRDRQRQPPDLPGVQVGAAERGPGTLAACPDGVGVLGCCRQAQPLMDVAASGRTFVAGATRE